LVSSVAELVSTSDVVFVCVPLDVQMDVFRSIADAVTSMSRTDVVITDVSSVKGVEARDASALFAQAGATFVPGHPMAGTEFSGFQASTEDMFQAATWVLCPGGASVDVVGLLTELVLLTGARVSLLDTDSHDAAVGSISHLPYVAAASLANVLSASDIQNLALQLAAGSFRDGTRVAGSEPWLSASMVNFNRDEVLRLLNVFQGEIAKMVTALRDDNNEQVLQLFSNAQALRRKYESVKAGSGSRNVEWPLAEAIGSAVAACRGGSLISALARDANVWRVVLEGTE
jgi:prephenate dehydrogenase